MTAPCTHGFPKPANCWDCMEDGNIEQRPHRLPGRPTNVRSIEASFDGHCNGCNLGIHEGQLISRLTDGTYQHDECAGT